MLQPRILFVISALSVFTTAFFVGRPVQSVPTTTAAKGRIFEIRTYTTEKGKLPVLLARFRDHTTRLFEKHGMTNIGYWTPTDEPRSQNTLIYILAHESRAAAEKSWKDFHADPDWQRVQKESEAAGKIVNHVESVFAEATDFSAIR